MPSWNIEQVTTNFFVIVKKSPKNALELINKGDSRFIVTHFMGVFYWFFLEEPQGKPQKMFLLQTITLKIHNLTYFAVVVIENWF